MASMASSSTFCNLKFHTKPNNISSLPRILLSQKQDDMPTDQINRRELILKTSELATIGAIFNFSGKKPNYLGVQKNPAALALCPATKNCVSTSENINDSIHYAPPWNYNPEGRKNRVSREEAMEELIEVIESTTPDKFTPRIVERKEDYVRVEYQSSILGFVDDVEFWFPPGKGSTVEYRSASRLGNFDFDVNRKRIKALRQELEKKGWASQDTI
ncbi:uncharacterized protein LOC133313676 [Gastrolobium bilobum]|uniref:uncharacterized protein LOC133313676 n=1 Tax=Gastrolobium bilobum TaxID=150636 RepID=UPI002AB11B18|nr:uncharacterized protein LOC133313676 [Gastrolobium bilobum]